MADEPAQEGAHEEFEIQFSDLHDGTLAEPAKAALLAHLEGCAACTAAYAEFEETMRALGALKGGPAGKPAPPAEFVQGVEETIHRRSAGRFFGRKTFGDRVPFGWLLIAAMVVLVAIAAVLYSSTTGSLRVRPAPEPPQLAPGAEEAVQPR